MRLKLLIGAVATLSLLAACGSKTSGGGAGGGGQTTGTTSGADECGGAYMSVAGNPCIDREPSQCGAALLECTGDADCSVDANTVCHECDATFSFCAGKCTTDADCPGQTCDAGGHCVPKTCAASGDCPGNLTCSAADGSCVRKTCIADSDCSGYCVFHVCSETQAFCSDCT
jgi:hypothetical protein